MLFSKITLLSTINSDIFLELLFYSAYLSLLLLLSSGYIFLEKEITFDTAILIAINCVTFVALFLLKVEPDSEKVITFGLIQIIYKVIIYSLHYMYCIGISVYIFMGIEGKLNYFKYNNNVEHFVRIM
jgi:hypothetical protein